MAEGKRLTRSNVGISWQNKFGADSVHGNREAFENILLMPLTTIPQMQRYCLKNRVDGLKPTVFKRCDNKMTKPETGKEQRKRGERCNVKPTGLCLVAWPSTSHLEGADGCQDHRQKQLVSVCTDGTW